ncbi:MAG: hypothetical protein RML15_09185 [Bacteroidota bacterium]|nr:hypothetical protein [Candidatus Kapabacteria bacterium]MDW8075649.1 hypothetical protein [Bacteroidota bacterium]MDW8272565.1 hypothetical protein [Bacteroidota bacterium]
MQRILRQLQDADRRRRNIAADALSAGLEQQVPLLSYIVNMVLTDERPAPSLFHVD